MRRLLRWLIGLVVVVGAVRDRQRAEEREPIVQPGEGDPRAELAVVVLLLLAAACGVLFVVAYALEWSTQVLGGAIAAAFLLLAAALTVVAQRLVATEELAGEYPPDEHPQAQAEVAQIVRESGGRLTRKRLLAAAAVTAGTAVGGALVTPALSLGPALDTSRLNESPWRRGVWLVHADGRPVRADEIGTGTFVTAFPAGADRDAIGAPLILVRIDPSELRLPAGREGWAPGGILAYSKICTHAGCAVALYRNPTFPATQPGRALVCPCHYSTFAVASGGTVEFGPAGRPLPQLPLEIAGGELRAAGGFSSPPGPSWWGSRSA